MEKRIICVDAGGTSSKAALFDLENHILVKGYGKSGSPAVSSDWYLHIDDAISNVLLLVDTSNIEITFIQIGVSGISALSSFQFAIDYFQNKYHTKVDITSDTQTALYSVLDEHEKEGIVVISGTGVGIFGKNEANKTMLIGGWGHIIREYGSAYSIVHRFCVCMIDHYEATMEVSPLEKSFLAFCKLENIRDLNHLFYQKSKDEIASYSVFFKEKAKENNQEAIQLLIQQGRFLGEQVKHVMMFLNLKNKTKIGLRGGFLENDGEFVIRGIKEYLFENEIELNFEKTMRDQIYGVYHLAKIHMEEEKV